MGAKEVERKPENATAQPPGPWWDIPSEKLGRLGLALLFLATVPMLTKIFTSDFGTHIAMGRYTIQNLRLPTVEFLNYTALGGPNFSHEWLFQALLYLVLSGGGPYAVSFLIWAVVLGIFFFMYRATILRGAHPLLAVLAIFAFSGFLRIRIQPRPEIFTYLFVSLTIYILTAYYFGDRKKLLWAFPPLMLLWANFHGSYLIAFVLYGAFFVDALARAAWRREFQWHRIRTWVIPPMVTGVAGLLVCGLNPYGYEALLAPLHLLSRGGGQSNVLMSISELTPVKGTGFYAYYKAAAVFAAVSLALGAAGRRVYLIDVFLLAIAFKGAYDSARAVSMMGLFISPAAAIQLTGFLGAAAGWLALKWKEVPNPGEKEKGKGKGSGKTRRAEAFAVVAGKPPRPRVSAGYVALAALLSVGLLVFGGTTLAFSFSQLEYGVGITEHKFSFKAAEFLRKNPIKGNMFNFFDIGGFLDWQLYPQALTFIDGRAISPNVFQEHQVVTAAMTGWEAVLQRYGITYVVTKAMDSSGMILPLVPALANSPDWHLVFADGLFLVFVRNSPENLEYIRRFGIDKSAVPRHIIQEAHHYMYLGVSPVVAYSTMANMYLALGDRNGAIRILRKGLEEAKDPYLQGRLTQLEQGGGIR